MVKHHYHQFAILKIAEFYNFVNQSQPTNRCEGCIPRVSGSPCSIYGSEYPLKILLEFSICKFENFQ